jgi:hypothetical protein
MYVGIEMRPSSLRALLLALAMVFQTIAAGAGVARAASGPIEASFAAHCEKSSGNADAADAHHEQRRHSCDSCCLCSGPPTASFAQFVPVVISPRDSRVVSFILVETCGVPARLARAQFARGPPRPL